MIGCILTCLLCGAGVLGVTACSIFLYSIVADSVQSRDWIDLAFAAVMFIVVVLMLVLVCALAFGIKGGC